MMLQPELEVMFNLSGVVLYMLIAIGIFIALAYGLIKEG